MSHYERCKECKIRFRELLEKIYGQVICEHRFPISTKPEDFREHPRYPVLNEIYTSLQKHRGFTEFVRASYVKVDYFLPEQGMIVEFDESQHFTEPRKIALSHYPSDLEIGFSRDAWIKHCDEIDAHDNDPPFRDQPWICRDEQRAWYDTLKDFLPENKVFHPTVRMYAREMEWCKLNPEKSEDFELFHQIIKNKQAAIEKQRTNFWQIQTEEDRNTLDAFIWFEYLLNKMKLQYLLDCCEGDFNDDSQYLCNPSNKQKIVNSESGGRAIKAYFNQKLRDGTVPGPLFINRDPKNYELTKKINEVNNLLYSIISSSKNWFELFCEYVLIKTVLHEFYVDSVDDDNIIKNAYGFSTFNKINLDVILKDASREKKRPIDTVYGHYLRDFIVNSLLLGIDPTVEKLDFSEDAYPCELRNKTYESFLSKRSDWIKIANNEIRKIKQKKGKESLEKVMRWNESALCAFDAGPVFLRKRKEFLIPLFCQAISDDKLWSSNQSLRDKIDKIVKKDVNILIGSYWEEKYIADQHLDNQTLAFLKGNKNLAAIVRQKDKDLDSQFNALGVSTVADLQHFFPSKKSKLKININADLQERSSKITREKSEADTGQRIVPSKENWTESIFLARLQEKPNSEKEVEIAKKLIEWARCQKLDLGEKTHNLSFIPFIRIPGNTRQLFEIKVNGKLVIDFKYINAYPQFENEEKRQQLVTYLNTIKGLNFTTSSISDLKFPSCDLVILEDLQNFEAFITMSTWFFDELRKGKQQ